MIHLGCGYPYITLGEARHGRSVAFCKYCQTYFVVNLADETEEETEEELAMAEDRYGDDGQFPDRNR